MTLQGAIKQLHELRCNEDMPVFFKPAIAEVINVLLMDAEEVRHGRWTEEDDAIIHGHCSSCGWNAIWQETDVFGMPYCPNCGSRMDEVDNEN